MTSFRDYISENICFSQLWLRGGCRPGTRRKRNVTGIKSRGAFVLSDPPERVKGANSAETVEDPSTKSNYSATTHIPQTHKGPRHARHDGRRKPGFRREEVVFTQMLTGPCHVSATTPGVAGLKYSVTCTRPSKRSV